MIWPVKQENMLCDLINCVVLVYIWSLNNNLGEHTVFNISVIFIPFFIVWPMNKSDTLCRAYIYCTCESSCHHWYSINLFLIHCIIKNLFSNSKHQMTYCLHFPWPSCQLCTHIRLKPRLRVGWKTLPNLIFKLKFQT